MIVHVSICDFAIIRELNIDLSEGLNIVTGETGAGKSIVIEAISMALGSRADRDYVRAGCSEATVTLLVDWSDLDLAPMLEEAGVPTDCPLVLHRQISAVGRSISRINGQVVPLTFMNKLSSRLADIHGQYDHQSLLNASRHIELLDLFGDEAIGPLRLQAAQAFHSLVACRKAIRELEERTADRERQKDLMTYELDEIRLSQVELGEDEQLEEDIGIMQNSQRIYDALETAYELLQAQEGSASEQLGSAVQQLSAMENYSSALKDLSSAVKDAYYNLEDLTRNIRQQKDNMDYASPLLDEKIERQEQLSRLKRKYGGSLKNVLLYQEKLEADLAAMDQAEENLSDLQRQLVVAQEVFDLVSARLRKLREGYAQSLATDVSRELADLHFRDARFLVQLGESPPSASGIDQVEFLISANKGEEPRSLAKVASGGELSRIMLALKAILGRLDGIPTLIFDEIDAGISGAAADVVGKKLQDIARSHQIFCITHLPQIAAFGNHHYRIEKVSDQISTHTTIKPLSQEDRVEEIARLLSGTKVSDQARHNAQELLDRARDMPQA